MSCKLVQVGTEEHGKMLKRIQILEGGRVLPNEAENWKIEREKRRITWKKYRRPSIEFEMGGFMAQKSLWNLAREKLQDRGALSKEEGDVVGGYYAMHEENFLSSWLKEDLVCKEERRKDDKKIRGEVRKKGEEKRRRKETMRKKRTTVILGLGWTGLWCLL